MEGIGGVQEQFLNKTRRHRLLLLGSNNINEVLKSSHKQDENCSL